MSSRIQTGVLAAAMAVIAGASFASQASALKVVSSPPTNIGAGTQGFALANCPEGQHEILGGGVYSTGLFGSSWVNSTQPLAGAWMVYVDAATAVSVTAKVVCIHRTIPVKFKHASTPLPPHSRRSKRVDCPSGYRVTGGGGYSNGTYDTIDLKTSRPKGHGTAWFASSANFSGTQYGLTVYAICVKGSFADHLVIRSSKDTAAAGVQEADVANCPNGAKVVGGGTEIKSTEPSNLNTTDPFLQTSWSSSVDALGGSPVPFKTFAVCHK